MAQGRQAMHLPCYGAAAGQRLIDAAEQGPVVLGELIQRHGIDCDYSVPGIIMAAHTEKALRAPGKRPPPRIGCAVKLFAARRSWERLFFYIRALILEGK